MDEAFNRIRNFLNANGLQVNKAKMNLTEFMSWQKHAKTGGVPPDITAQEYIEDKDGNIRVEDKHVMDKSHCRILGLTLQNNLTWEAHLKTGKKSVLPVVRQQIGLISRICPSLSQKARIQLLSSLAISKMTQIDVYLGDDDVKPPEISTGGAKLSSKTGHLNEEDDKTEFINGNVRVAEYCSHV